MSVLVCLDKFRGSATAAQACAALADGLRAGGVEDVVEVPVADGGEGTVEALARAGWTTRTVTVTGPRGVPVAADFAVLGGRAVVEMAQASGQALRGTPPDATAASTVGTGQLILAALDAGCHELVLTVGGSATTDGGAGMLQALGARLLAGGGTDVAPGGGGLAALTHVDLSTLDTRLRDVRVLVAADVDNPLLGPRGAAAVFGPQKGADGAQVTSLDDGLRHFADLLEEAAGVSARERPGAGAAGGLGFGAFVALAAGYTSGTDFVIDELGLTSLLDDARLAVVGEGRLDEQSLDGKAPVGVARRAHQHGVPVVAVAGQVTVDAGQLAAAGIGTSHSLLDRADGVDDAMTRALELLTDLGTALAGAIPDQRRRTNV